MGVSMKPHLGRRIWINCPIEEGQETPEMTPESEMEQTESGYISDMTNSEVHELGSSDPSNDIVCENEDTLNQRSVGELNAAFSMLLLGANTNNIKCAFSKHELIFIKTNKWFFRQDPESKDNEFMLMIINATSVDDEKHLLTALEYLLHPTQLDVQNNLRQTALILSVIRNIPSVTSRLVALGADTQKLDVYGNTAMHYGCEFGNINCLNALVSGQNTEEHREHLSSMVSWQNKQGDNCVDLAINSKNMDIFDFLVMRFSVNINYKNSKTGNTALHKAVANRELETIALLLQYSGVDVNVKNFSGFTALRLLYVSESGSCCEQTVEQLLLSYGAMP